MSDGNENWIAWEGGECPVDRDTKVDVRFPNGVTMRGYKASDWIDGPTDWWKHESHWEGDHIVFYRLSPLPSAPAGDQS